MLPETKGFPDCITLISWIGVAAPISILTSSNPILPETLFVYINRINRVEDCGTSVNIV